VIKNQKGEIYDMIKNNLHFFKRKIALTLATIMIFSFVANVKQVGIQKINAAETKVTYGDVNSDGTINLLDMILLKSYLTENNTKGFSVEAADVDDDGEVSAKDAVELSMYLMNQIGSFSYEMNVDTDGDGLSDYVEKEILGTKYDIPDSDGDDLDDYSEVYLCETEPTKPDTGNTGKKDSLKDADEDGLTNGEEIKLGTSPTLSDTDEDKLSDFDEVKKYKTNPNKLYTDDDLISDFGEVILGLNPLVEKSDGIQSDSERIFDQQLTSDNIIFKEINTEDSPYKLSLITKSSGYIDESVSVDISSYSNYLQNDAVNGDIVDIEYADIYKVENITINFNVTGNAENFYIFRYFEDVNMLLPVETQYDGNNVYTEGTEDGTYCIVDLNKWAENTASLSKAENVTSVYNAVCDSSDTKSTESLEVYFLMYVKSTLAYGARSSVANASRAIIDYCNNTGKDVKIYFASYTGSIVTSKETGNSYVSNVSTDEEIEEMLSRSGSATGSLDTENFNYSLTRTLKKSFLEISSANENSKKYCFVIDVNFQPSSADKVAVVDEMKGYGVDFSFICNEYNDNIANYESLSSDGSHYRWISDFSEIVTDKVLNFTIAYNVNTGLFNKIPYDEKLITSEWKDIYEKFYSKDLSSDDREKLLDEIKKLGLPDTDGDGSPDCLEIFMKFITFDENGNIILPTYDQLAKDALENGGFGLKGLDELASIMKKKGIEISGMRILPLISNPAFEDSDSDGIPDSIDIRPSEEDIISVDDSIINDSSVFENDYTTISDNTVDGNGFASSHIGDKKNNFIEYTRFIRDDGKATSKFYIEPDDNNDYLITVDTGKNDDCQIKVSYESGFLFFKKDNVVSNIELDDGMKEKEQTENVMRNRKAYFLEEGKKYKVVVTVKSTDFVDNNYSVCFEQNNWAYMKNGAVVDYSPAKPTQENYRNTIVYLPSDKVRKTIESYELKFNGAELHVPNFEKLTKEQAEHSCNDYADDIIEGFNLCPEADIISAVNDINTSVGVISLLKDGSPVGVVATLAGGYLTVLSHVQNAYKNQLVDSLYEGKYNIQMLITEWERVDYPSFKRINMSRIDWLPWSYNNGYINKYHSQTRYSNCHNIRANSIEKLEFYTLTQDEDGKWKIGA